MTHFLSAIIFIQSSPTLFFFLNWVLLHSFFPFITLLFLLFFTLNVIFVFFAIVKSFITESVFVQSKYFSSLQLLSGFFYPTFDKNRISWITFLSSIISVHILSSPLLSYRANIGVEYCYIYYLFGFLYIRYHKSIGTIQESSKDIFGEFCFT